MNIVYFGSSDFSIPVLESLLRKHSVSLVVTTPEKKKGRGQKISGTVVKDFALKNGLALIEPEKLSDPKWVEQIKNFAPDFIVIASYGKLVPSSIFKLPKMAPLNVHPSLLPKHRGASPIQRAILEGDPKTGVSIAEITKDLDAGDLYAQIETPIDSHENASQLSYRLAQMAADLLNNVIEQCKSGTITKTPQDSSKNTYAKKITKEEGLINWKEGAPSIHNQIRAYFPWPGAFTFLNGKRLKVLESEIISDTGRNKLPGAVGAIDSTGITVQAQDGLVKLKRVQLEGRSEMGAYEFALGQRLKKEDQFN